MLVDYAKQETISPLKALGRYLGLGLAGSALVGIGIGFIALGVLRYTQTLDAFGGDWSGTLPYVFSLATLVLAIVICMALLVRAKRKVA